MKYFKDIKMNANTIIAGLYPKYSKREDHIRLILFGIKILFNIFHHQNSPAMLLAPKTDKHKNIE